MMKKLYDWIGPSAAILMLIYTIYYLAMRSTGGILRTVDVAVAAPVALVCVAVLLYRLLQKRKNRQK